MPIPQWKRAVEKPGGSIPEGMLNKVMVALGTVLVLALVISTGFCGGGADEEADAATTASSEAGTVRPTQSMETELDAVIARREAQRAAQERQDALADAQERLNADVAEAASGRGEASSPYANIPPELQQVLLDSLGLLPDPDMMEIQRQANLEELARRITSLRASPVALSYRGEPPEAVTTGGERAGRPVPLQPNVLDALEQRILPPGSQPPPSGQLEIPPPSTNRLPDYANPPHLITPADPPGWERVTEGSFLEAVLVTELAGEFPGPVLATVSVPFYSRDRQRVLVPRGARLIGSAQAVARRDQSALAVGFHRIVFPDGRHVPLRFIALGQEGATGLRDEVNRHYLSTFLAAGAVGILSGFATIRGNPYGGGAQGALASGGAGLAASGGQVLDRFLNRLPTVTIRAGHRLRVWLTSDVLLPLPNHP